MGTKYDDYGRPTESGFVSGFPTDPNASFTFSELLNKTYYDGYDGTTQLNLTSNPQYRGKVRRSENKVLGSVSTFLHSTLTYDAYGRLTAAAGNNYLNAASATAENTTSTYDWADNKLTENRTHNPGAGATTGIQTINYSWNYDQAGRSTNHYLNLNSQNTHLAEYNYDHRDQMIERNLHYAQYGATWAWLQSIDYTYNDMGWLTAVNGSGSGGTAMALPTACSVAMPNPGVTTLTKFPETNDLFYFELRYDQLFANNAAGGNIGGITGGTAQKAGNISQLAWRVRGRDRQAYNFTYDHLSRLTTAAYYDVNASNTATASNRYNETLAYDLRGNITALQRTGYYSSACNYGQIDNLTYTYTANTNRLASIADSAPATQKTHGFNPGSGGTGYTYDANGNLKTDSYKGITNIAYNHLNLPNVVTFSSGNSIEWIYDAAGMKLRKIVKQGATVQYEQTYAGGLEYRKNGTGSNRVEALYHAEGRYLNLNAEVSNTLLWHVTNHEKCTSNLHEKCTTGIKINRCY